MGEWVVELAGDTVDRRFLSHIFRSGTTGVEKQQDALYRIADELAGLTDANLVKERAEVIVAADNFRSSYQ